MATCTCSCTCAWPPPAPAARTCPLIAFQRFRGIEFRRWQGWAGGGLVHLPKPNSTDGKAPQAWCRKVTAKGHRPAITACHSNNTPRYYNSCFCWWAPEMWLRGGRGEGTGSGTCLPVHPHHPSCPSALCPSTPTSPSVRRGPPAFRGLEEATSPFLPSPALAWPAVPARVLWGERDLKPRPLACV